MPERVPEKQHGTTSRPRPRPAGSGLPGRAKVALRTIRALAYDWFSRKGCREHPLRPDPRIGFTGETLGLSYTYGENMGFSHPHERRKRRHREPVFDEAGCVIIPMWDGWHRQPTLQANLAIQCFEAWIDSGDEALLDRCCRLSEGLLAVAEPWQAGGAACVAWPQTYTIPQYAPHPRRWLSGLTQARAISTLCRAYQATGREEFLDAAVGAAGPFAAEISAGGVAARDAEGNVYYEEVAIEGATCHILNGFLSCLFGLHELWRVTGEGSVRALFDAGVATCKAPGVLDRYDLGYWTAYDQSEAPPARLCLSRFYNWLHARQLWIMFHLTGDGFFRRWAEKVAGYDRDPACAFRAFGQTMAYFGRKAPAILRRVLGRGERGTRAGGRDGGEAAGCGQTDGGSPAE